MKNGRKLGIDVKWGNGQKLKSDGKLNDEKLKNCGKLKIWKIGKWPKIEK